MARIRGRQRRLWLASVTLPTAWDCGPIRDMSAARQEPTSGAVVGLPYIIVYEVDDAANEVAIIGIFHGAQDRDKPKW